LERLCAAFLDSTPKKTVTLVNTLEWQSQCQFQAFEKKLFEMKPNFEFSGICETSKYRLGKLVEEDNYVRSADGSAGLKRFLVILSDLIFECSVDPGKPSFVAAPDARTPVVENAFHEKITGTISSSQ
jgi:hypothetical protein